MSQLDDAPLALVIDDDEVFRNRLCRALSDRKWQTIPAADGEQGLALARDRSPDLVLVDLRMPGRDGIDILEDMRKIDASMTIIVLTGYGSIPTTISAMKRGADHYLSKPADADQILSAYESLRTPAAENRTPDSVPTLARVEWEHMQRVIADCDGNISQAARLLGIHRRSLQRKLSKIPPSR